MTSISRKDALEIIEEIRRHNGGIRESDRQNTPQDVLEVLEHMKDRLGNAVKTLATQLYSDDTRFVFELIQNAEDNSYTAAIKRGAKPYINFSLHQDRVVIDSNEDGFSADNVRAICDIGQSTKHNIQGFIGEKGIGFKSVFRVAEKVYIQSGPFSFYFQHRKGEKGLGMVTPISHPHEDLPKGVRTRMTLMLLPSKFDTCKRELKEIPDTFILFLLKLKTIKVSVYYPDASPSITTYSCTNRGSLSPVILTKTINSTSVQFFYRVHKKKIVNLPEHPDREGLDKAEVTLAFPIDQDHIPVIESQYLFAFLPVRKFGFNFLIQSDFVTDASRQDIDHSPWNKAIMYGVAEAFVGAVGGFNQDSDPFQYQWLKYLPTDGIYDKFWNQFKLKLFGLLQTTPVLRSWSGKLCKPLSMRHLTPEFLDKNGCPLFDDLEDECYLSPKYSWDSDRKALLALGSGQMEYALIIRRIRPYLKQDCEGEARIFSIPFHDDWHSRVGRMLRNGLNTDHARSIKKLSLIPLEDGGLASAYKRTIYFPYDKNEVQIPVDLALRLVDTSAISNPSLKSLYVQLGVEYCTPDEVVPEIPRRYNYKDAVNLEQSVSHLWYMFHYLPEDDELDSKMFIMDVNETRVYRRFVTFGAELTVDDVYFDTGERYGIRNLQTEVNRAKGTEKLNFHFIHPSYLAADSSNNKQDGSPWTDWLHDKARVRRIPRLCRRRGAEKLEKIWSYISKVCPSLLLGALRVYWPQYPDSEKTLRREMMHCKASCQNLASYPLCGTYLPLEDLKKTARNLFVDDKFPFLLLPDDWSNDNILVEWNFLTEFGVSIKVDLDFYLHALSLFEDKCPGGISSEERNAIFQIYEGIVSHAAKDDYGSIRERIKIYIEGNDYHDERWTSSECCVWEGPPFLSVKYPLATYKGYSESLKIKTLFCDILKIGNATWRTYLDELKVIKSKNEVNFENTCAIYEYLWKIRDTNQIAEIRVIFQSEMLVYVRHAKKWCSLDSCLWTDSPNIGKKYGIQSVYPNLEKFFIEHLKIKSPTVATYVDQLTSLTSKTSPNSQDVKDAILTINRLLTTETSLSRELKIMKTLKCFPMRPSRDGGNVQYQSCQKYFIILDHVDYGKLFQGKLPFLDFSLREVHSLKPLWIWIGLEDRYLSRLVTISTDVQQPSLEPDHRLTENFRRRAKYLYRCSCHYGSPKTNNDDQKLLHLFQKVDIYTSDGFTRTLHLNQNGLNISVDSDSGMIHLDDSNDSLKIYVPRNKRHRELCYATQLGIQLADYVHIKSPEARKTFCLVLTTRSSTVDPMLDSHGIVPLEESRTSNGSEPAAESNSESGEDDDVISVSATSRHSSRLPSSHPVLVDGTLVHDSTSELLSPLTQNARQRGHGTYRMYSDSSSSGTRIATPSTPLGSPNRISQPNGDPTASDYTRLLQRVVDAARIAQFPATGLFDMHELASALPNIDLDGTGQEAISGLPFGSRTQNQLAHDIKIGAAGELFAFELLLGLSLPDFGRHNWQSTIRKEVRVHPDYHDLEPWRGFETSDITYKDTEGSLTTLLIDNRYLNPSAEQWTHRQLKYYIEVKTTTTACNTPFYMSKAQFKRMQDMRIENGVPSPTNAVYVIFRVYNLNNENNIGLRVYVDPGTLHANGELEFTPETYSVTPVT